MVAENVHFRQTPESRKPLGISRRYPFGTVGSRTVKVVP